MTIFSSIGNGFKSIGNTIRDASKAVYKDVVQPTYKSVVKPVVGYALHKADQIEKTVEKEGAVVLNSANKVVGSVGQAAENLSQPIFLYIALGVGGLILLSYLNNKR